MLSRKSAFQLENSDCLVSLKKFPSNFVNLIYLDPPFFTQRKHELKTKDGLRTYSFEDKWNNLNEYLNFLSLRLAECHRVLHATGSLFFHCDSTAAHYIKIELDKIFGRDQFRSEIIWSYKRWSNAKKGLLNNHQTIFFYSKTDSFKFNFLKTDYSPTTNVDQIVQKRTRDSRAKSTYQKDIQGQPILVTAKDGVPLGDVWEIPFLNPKAKERVDYPTQKPILLLEKILQICSDENDIVLDPFCGSGTTLVAAKFLQRRGIGIDANPAAIQLTQSRLNEPVKTESQLLMRGKKAYLNQNSKLTGIVKSLGATPVLRNKGIDGLLNLFEQLIPFKVVFTESELIGEQEKILKAIQKNKFKCYGLYCQFKLLKSKKQKWNKNYSSFLFESSEDLARQIKMKSQFD